MYSLYVRKVPFFYIPNVGIRVFLPLLHIFLHILCFLLPVQKVGHPLFILHPAFSVFFVLFLPKLLVLNYSQFYDSGSKGQLSHL